MPVGRGAQGGEQPHARQKTTTFSPQKNNPLAKKNNINGHDFSRNLAEEICFCEGVGPIAMICHFA